MARRTWTVTKTMRDWGITLLRLSVGALVITHALPAIVPMRLPLGGSWMAWIDTAQVELPVLLATSLVGLIELVCGLALVAGAYTVWAALMMIASLGTSAWQTYWRQGWFLNWAQEAGIGHGVEFHVLLIATLCCLVLAGPGAASIDRRRARAAEQAAAGRARLGRV